MPVDRFHSFDGFVRDSGTVPGRTGKPPHCHMAVAKDHSMRHYPCARYTGLVFLPNEGEEGRDGVYICFG